MSSLVVPIHDAGTFRVVKFQQCANTDSPNAVTSGSHIDVRCPQYSNAPS